jgi:hypothetical protein
MPKRHRNRCARGVSWLGFARRRCVQAIRHAWRALHRWWHPVPVEVLIADKNRRRALERELRTGLRCLQRVLGAPLPTDLAVVVQQVITTDRQLAGCYQVGQLSDGRRFALVRLALQVHGQRLSTDELLAVLAEQCIGLATQDGGPSVLVPVDLEPAVPPAPRLATPLRVDPLAPRTNGTPVRERIA